MKMIKKISLLLVLSSFVLFFNPIFSNANTSQVSDETTLIEAINSATNDDTIELTTNITLTKPLEITGKNIIINGNGHTITRNANNWSQSSDNGSLITAGSTGTKLTLTNITLTNAQKYGVQSYNGAYVILDGVNISNCGFGGVLVNAGTLEVRNLNLGHNGREDSNNGIEFAKGTSVPTGDNKPTLIMNGKLTSSEQTNVVYVAINDKLSGFELVNEENSTNKIFLNGNTIVVTDQNNNIIFQSNEFEDMEVAGDPFVENVAPEPEPEPEPILPQNDETPKTGSENNLAIALLIIITSSIGILILKKYE